MGDFESAEKDFTLSGRRFRKKPRDFIDAIQGQPPKPLQTWAMNVAGTLFPPKQVVACTTGFNGFTTQQANAVLRRFGFEPFKIHGDEAHTPLIAGEIGTDTIASADRQVPSLRLTALREAIQFASQRPDSTADDVLDTAEKFEFWLNRSQGAGHSVE